MRRRQVHSKKRPGLGAVRSWLQLRRPRLTVAGTVEIAEQGSSAQTRMAMTLIGCLVMANSNDNEIDNNKKMAIVNSTANEPLRRKETSASI